MATKKKAAKKAAPKKAGAKKSNPVKIIMKEQPSIRVIVEVVVRNEGNARAGITSQSGGGNPYEFIIKIKKLEGLIVQRIDIQNGTIYNDDLSVDPTDPTIDLGKTSSIVPGATFLLTIIATGDSFTSTTFNLTCDGKKVFEQDQEIKITGSGRGGYRNLAVPLP